MLLEFKSKIPLSLLCPNKKGLLPPSMRKEVLIMDDRIELTEADVKFILSGKSFIEFKKMDNKKALNLAIIIKNKTNLFGSKGMPWSQAFLTENGLEFKLRQINKGQRRTQIKMNLNESNEVFIHGAFSDYLHLKNMITILLTDEMIVNDVVYLGFQSIRNVLNTASTDGLEFNEAKEEEFETYNSLRFHYLFDEIIAHIKEKNLNPKVYTDGIKEIITTIKSTNTKRNKGEDASYPKPRKVDFSQDFTMKLDSNCYGFTTFDSKNEIRLTLYKSQPKRYFTLTHLGKKIDNINDISSVSLTRKGNDVFINFVYKVDIVPLRFFAQTEKIAGLDLGYKNIANIFIADETSNSFFISTDEKIKAMQNLNKRIDALAPKISASIRQIKSIKEEIKETKEIIDCSLYIDEKEINSLLSSQIENLKEEKDKRKTLGLKHERLQRKKKDTMKTFFNQSIAYIVDNLIENGVTTLVCSRNLGELKQGQTKAVKWWKRLFQGVPFMQFLDTLQFKCQEVGIAVVEVDEAYTSKTSFFSKYNAVYFQNRNKIKKKLKKSTTKKAKQELMLLNEEDGRLIRQSGIRDNFIYKNKELKANKVVNLHSDIQGSASHILLYDNEIDVEVYKDLLFKFCRPLKIDIEANRVYDNRVYDNRVYGNRTKTAVA